MGETEERSFLAGGVACAKARGRLPSGPASEWTCSWGGECPGHTQLLAGSPGVTQSPPQVDRGWARPGHMKAMDSRTGRAQSSPSRRLPPVSPQEALAGMTGHGSSQERRRQPGRSDAQAAVQGLWGPRPQFKSSLPPPQLSDLGHITTSPSSRSLFSKGRWEAGLRIQASVRPRGRARGTRDTQQVLGNRRQLWWLRGPPCGVGTLVAAVAPSIKASRGVWHGFLVQAACVGLRPPAFQLGACLISLLHASVSPSGIMRSLTQGGEYSTQHGARACGYKTGRLWGQPQGASGKEEGVLPTG